MSSVIRIRSKQQRVLILFEFWHHFRRRRKNIKKIYISEFHETSHSKKEHMYQNVAATFSICQNTSLILFIYYTRELPGHALVNISTGQIFMGKGINQKKKNMMTT